VAGRGESKLGQSDFFLSEGVQKYRSDCYACELYSGADEKVFHTVQASKDK
jgi:hypothetical protein